MKGDINRDFPQITKMYIGEIRITAITRLPISINEIFR